MTKIRAMWLQCLTLAFEFMEKQNLLKHFFLTLLLSFSALPAGHAKPSSEPQSEKLLRHAVHHLFIQGHPLGEMIRKDERTPQGNYRHSYSMKMNLIRGAQVIRISSDLKTISDQKHQLISYHLNKKEGELSIQSVGQVKDNQLHITTTRSGNKTKQTIELNQGTMSALSYDFYVWLNRNAVQKFERDIFHEDLGTFAHQLSNVFRSEKDLRIEHHALGMQTHETYDLQGRLLSAHTLEMGLWALAPGMPPPKPNEKPIDIMQMSTWKTKKVPKSLASVTYEIEIPGTLEYQPYQNQNQKMISKADHLITVEVQEFKPAAILLSDIEKQKLTSHTALEPHQHPQIRQQALELQKKNPKPEELVRAVSDFVFHHIENKSLDRGAASALETLKSQKGDCTEHSILASALLRSLGYPTRLVDGVIAFDRQLGYHEWVEVYIDGQGFVPLDPTFNEFPAGPNRLVFAVGDSSPEGMLQLGITATQLLSGITVSLKSFKKKKSTAK